MRAKMLVVLAVAVLGIVGVGTWTQALSAKKAPGAAKSAENASDTVWIKRSDGGESCSPDKAQSLEAGAEELKKAKIQILESTKADDGKMHIQMCGAPTGSQNAYKIKRSDLGQAVALGFQEAKN